MFRWVFRRGDAWFRIVSEVLHQLNGIIPPAKAVIAASGVPGNTGQKNVSQDIINALCGAPSGRTLNGGVRRKGRDWSIRVLSLAVEYTVFLSGTKCYPWRTK
jgi:hypothetical protein